MPTGTPDWHTRTRIVAQDVDKLLVDIVAQTISKLAVDIVAQSIGNIKTDIAAASIGNVPIDIKANSIGNIPVDLKANSIGNIPVDIAASSIGNLGIDIKAQTLEKINIDIIAQSIERILQAPSYGGARVVEASGALDIGETLEIFSVTGKGIVYGGHVYITALDDPNNGRIEVNIDNFGYKGYSFAEYNTRGLTAENRFFVYNTIYNVSNRMYGFGFTPRITFESSYAVRLSVSSSASCGLNYWCVFIYALRA